MSWYRRFVSSLIVFNTLFIISSTTPQPCDILDVIFLVDLSCGLPEDDCSVQIGAVADYILNIKFMTSPRIGLFYFGAHPTEANNFDLQMQISLDDRDYNDNYWIESNIDRTQLQSDIQNVGTNFCNQVAGITSPTNLYDAIYEAVHQFGRVDEPVAPYREKKIVIISNCVADSISDVCSMAPMYVNNKKIDVVVINVGGISNQNSIQNMDDLSTYLSCLVEGDPIIVVPDVNAVDFESSMDDYTEQMCLTDQPTTTMITLEPIGCDIDSGLDVVFLVDQGCGMSPTVCTNYLDGVFEYILSIKKYSDPRVAYIHMQSTSPDPFVSLNNNDFNDLTDQDKFLTTTDAMQSKIRGQDCINGNLQTPELVDSINKAIIELNTYSTPDRVKKIVIISNCKDADRIDVCSVFEDEIEVEITVVNIANPVLKNPQQIAESERNLYLKCLTHNDPTRLLSTPSTDPTDMESIVYDFWNEICETEEPQTTKSAGITTTSESTTIFETATTSSEPTITSESTTTSEYVDPCDSNSNMIGVDCSDDPNICPDCMRCCRVNKVCEWKPPAAESILNNVNKMNDDMNGVSGVYEYPMYSYILLVGAILFVLINNLFIGYYCVCKKNNTAQSEQYEKCDIVELE